MSEYQYFEFLAIDRSLGPSETAFLRSLSTRATITPTSFQNTYNFGSFKGSPENMVDKYFDAHVYVSNWGVRRLDLRFPKRAVDRDVLLRYSVDEAFSFWSTDEHLIVEWECNEEAGDRVEGEGWMARLTPLRDEIERGDFRAFYLGWLCAVDVGEVAGDEREPAVPPGLGSLTPAQLSLCEFMGIDPDLVCAAATVSLPTEEDSIASSRISEWVAGLSEAMTREYVLLLAEGKSKEAERRVRQDFAACLRNSVQDEGLQRHTHGRLVSELLEEVKKCRAKRVEAERVEEARRRQEQRKQRERYLCRLAEDFGPHWKKAYELAERGIASTYDQALDLLVDLSEAYSLKQRQWEFSREIVRFRSACVRRGALIRRMDTAGLK